jgi:hypothetical protein
MCVIVKPRNDEAKAPEKGLLSLRKKKSYLEIPYFFGYIYQNSSGWETDKKVPRKSLKLECLQ